MKARDFVALYRHGLSPTTGGVVRDIQSETSALPSPGQNVKQPPTYHTHLLLQRGGCRRPFLKKESVSFSTLSSSRILHSRSVTLYHSRVRAGFSPLPLCGVTLHIHINTVEEYWDQDQEISEPVRGPTCGRSASSGGKLNTHPPPAPESVLWTCGTHAAGPNASRLPSQGQSVKRQPPTYHTHLLLRGAVVGGPFLIKVPVSFSTLSSSRILHPRSVTLYHHSRVRAGFSPLPLCSVTLRSLYTYKTP